MLIELTKFLFIAAFQYQESINHFYVLPNSEKVACYIRTRNSSTLTRGRRTSHSVNGRGVLSIPSTYSLRVGDTGIKSPRTRDFPDDFLDIKVIDMRDIRKVL